MSICEIKHLQIFLLIENQEQMFSRNFMRAFPIRKYARLSGATGTISTDLVMMGSRDLIPFRFGIFAFVSLVAITAYSGFDFFYQAIRHTPGPLVQATWESSVPESVRGPNDSIIENFHKIQEVKDWIRTIQPPQ